MNKVNEVPDLDHLNKNQFASSKVAIISNGINGQKIFTCVACLGQFNDKDRLQLHLLAHHDAYKFVCGVCGKGLKRREHLDRHMQEHSGRRPHICPDCGKGFKRKEHLNIHTAIHSGVKDLSCPVCKKKFSRKDHLHKHAQTHNRSTMEQVYIPVSDLELMGIKTEEVDEYDEYGPVITDVIGNAHEKYDETELDSMDMGDERPCHSRASNEDSSSNPIPFELAQQFLASNVNYTASGPFHIQQFLSANDSAYDPLRPHICPLCGKSYKRKDHLKIHSWTHKKKEQCCKECGKAFHTQDQLLVHINLAHIRSLETHRRHHVMGHQMNVKIENDIVPWPSAGSGSGTHECTICRRKFKRKQHLQVHYNVHLKNRDNVMWCPKCNEGFYNKGQYNSHACLGPAEQLSASASSGGSEDGHEDGHEDAKKENDPLELLEVVVNESPDADIDLDLDMDGEANIPEPRRVYLCKFCPKSFKRKDHYKIHQYIHSGVKTVFCPDCNKGFYRKDHLQKHMIVHARLKTKDPPQPVKVKKNLPALMPIGQVQRATNNVLPEITIHAPPSTKLRVPLQIKVPYQMVMSMDNGEKRAFTVDPQATDASAT